MIGTRLGSYEILATLGQGGMGEVYRARDAKLDREVAIKVLPTALSADAEALARFEREAQAVAALSHPNILAIFDFGRDGNVAYAAMELLDGETLRTRLEAGALPPRKALELAAEVARARRGARQGSHRDLAGEPVPDPRRQVKIATSAWRARAAGGSRASSRRADPGGSAPHGAGARCSHGRLHVAGAGARRGRRHRSDVFSLSVVIYDALAGAASRASRRWRPCRPSCATSRPR
jgi:hypothetical protein